MDMIVHQSVGPNEGPVLLTGIPHQAQVNETIRVVEEDVFFSIASVQNMVRATRHNNAWKIQCSDPREGGQALRKYVGDTIRIKKSN